MSKLSKRLDEAKRNQEMELMLQMVLASSMIAAHDQLQVGPGRAEKYLDSILSTELDIVDMINNDHASDHSLTWTHTKLEEALKNIFGDAWDKNKQVFSTLINRR